MLAESQSVFDEILERGDGGHRPAVLGSPSLTYADLLRQTESLAKTLQAIGAGDRSLVGVCVSMSSEYLVSLQIAASDQVVHFICDFQFEELNTLPVTPPASSEAR